ncbi:MAG: hypothetical protein NXI27_07355 [Alphaproteobacteria bacterium]|nr:hypothetical protein [Alphaproteobacteria bacterium]
MRTNLITPVLMSLVLLLTTGCNVSRPFESIPGLRPKAEIPNSTDPLTTQAGPADVSNPAEQDSQSQPPPAATTTAATSGNFLRTTSATTGTPAARSGTISFTPVIGAPVDAVQPLSRRLGAEAKNHGLTILQSTSGDSDHILKGYFSAFADGDKTTVAFVWDVLDSSGTRLHRIRGQEVAQGTASDPWEVVQASTMETIATKTITSYLSWRSTSGS